MSKKKGTGFRLGVKFAAVSTFALVLGYTVFLLGSEVILPWIVDTDWYVELSYRRCRGAAERFRDDVARQGLTMDEVAYEYEWDDPEFVYFLYEDEQDIGSDFLDATLEVPCADGTVYVCFFLSYEYHKTLARTICVILGGACLFLVILPYIYRIIARVARLSRDMEILAGGDLGHQVTVSGRDELAQLGQNMEEMRLSILGKIDREREAVRANSRLITALSHDLRTPLTKLTGYLEILQYDKCPPEERDGYLVRAREKAEQLREMSDELFRYFQITQEPAGVAQPQVVSGPTLLTQMLGEQCIDLQGRGLKVALPDIQGDWEAKLCPEDILRVFDNLFSNLGKYADPAQEIRLSWTETEETFTLVLENAIRKDGGTAEHRGFGVAAAQALMARNGGSLEAQAEGGRYRSTLCFPKFSQ